MQLYLYDATTKEYTEQIEAYIDPAETQIKGEPVFMYPANSTDIEPPVVLENQVCVFENESWIVKADYRGQYQCDSNLKVSKVETIGELEQGYLVITKEQANKIAEDKLYYIVLNGEIVINPNYEAEQAQKERERIGNLKCTKRVFALMLQELGISYGQLKELIATNEQAQLEWDLSVQLERGNPLIDIMALQLGITSEQLDGLFRYANGEITIEQFREIPTVSEMEIIEDITEEEIVNNEN
jgi:hypothetical protein